MLLDSVRHLLRLHVAAPIEPQAAPEPQPILSPEISLAEDDDPIWPRARIAVAEALWGEGFLLPGGGEEVVRLAKPLGLSAASSLLLVGAGTGGPPRHITAELGVWVTGYEANPRLIALANERSQRAGLGRRAQVESWDPQRPKFPASYFHHGMAIEPLRGEPPGPLLDAVARALKPGGQSCSRRSWLIERFSPPRRWSKPGQGWRIVLQLCQASSQSPMHLRSLVSTFASSRMCRGARCGRHCRDGGPSCKRCGRSTPALVRCHWSCERRSYGWRVSA